VGGSRGSFLSEDELDSLLPAPRRLIDGLTRDVSSVTERELSRLRDACRNALCADYPNIYIAGGMADICDACGHLFSKLPAFNWTFAKGLLSLRAVEDSVGESFHQFDLDHVLDSLPLVLCIYAMLDRLLDAFVDA
jgi:hypothetical protein